MQNRLSGGLATHRQSNYECRERADGGKDENCLQRGRICCTSLSLDLRRQCFNELRGVPNLRDKLLDPSNNNQRMTIV